MTNQGSAQAATTRTMPAKEWWRLYRRCRAGRDAPHDSAARHELRRLIDRHARPSITMPDEDGESARRRDGKDEMKMARMSSKPLADSPSCRLADSVRPAPATPHRRAILASAIAALLAPRAARARLASGGENVSQACPPPFVRQGDPIAALFEADLRQWANVNRHVRQAVVTVHPGLVHIVPHLGRAYAWETEFSVAPGPPRMPAPWVIVAACALEIDVDTEATP